MCIRDSYEGGCYAKVINLDKESEPDIYNAIKRDALLENVTVAADGSIDFADKSVTENTRVSYPIYHIENIVKPVSKGPHAKQVIFLSADAFGVLPPVSILNAAQTKYYFQTQVKLSLQFGRYRLESCTQQFHSGIFHYFRIALRAVSYTHLDVYKRQP